MADRRIEESSHVDLESLADPPRRRTVGGFKIHVTVR
jgi:hypothetical protein